MLARDRAQLRRNQVLAERAAAMRAAPTRSEAALWRELRRLGVDARRQVVLGQFVVDFYVPSCRLVIEVDGNYHRRRAAADARRDRELGRLGCRVLRLDAQLVLASPAEAVALVRAALTR